MQPGTDKSEGVVVCSNAGRYTVEISDNSAAERVMCYARSKLRLDSDKSPLVGDNVLITYQSGQHRIAEILPRRNRFVRPHVANIDCLLIVVSPVFPAPSPIIIDRITVAAEAADCEPVICFNKSDISTPALSEIYKKAGFQVHIASALNGDGIDDLTRRLAGYNLIALCGNSGAGKSSILNAMGLSLKTGEVSEKLGRGRHTTRIVELYTINTLHGTIRVIDTPGFSSFEDVKSDIDPARLPEYFREFEPYRDKCRFIDCRHMSEPDCAVKEAVENGHISASRYQSYLTLANNKQ